MPDREVPVLASDGVVLATEVHEPARVTGPTVVLSHGYSVDARTWALLTPELLAQGSRVVTWHQRGHGRSQHGPWPHYTLDQTASDLQRVIGTCAPEGDLVLVGHSMGAMSMMALAMRAPALIRERVRAAGFLSTCAGGLGFRVGGARGVLADAVADVQRAVPSVLGLVLDRRPGRLLSGPAFRSVVRGRAFGETVPGPGLELTAGMVRGIPVSVFLALGPQIARIHLYDGLPPYADIPTLVLHGDRDVITAPDLVHELLTYLPTARHVELQGCGHFTVMEAPEVVAAEVLELVGRVRQA